MARAEEDVSGVDDQPGPGGHYPSMRLRTTCDSATESKIGTRAIRSHMPDREVGQSRPGARQRRTVPVRLASKRRNTPLTCILVYPHPHAGLFDP